MFSTILTRLAWNLLIRKSSRRIILVIHGEQTLNEAIGPNTLRPLANASYRLLVFRLQLHGLDRSRPARCADWRDAETLGRAEGIHGRGADIVRRDPADSTWAVGRSHRSEKRWNNGADNRHSRVGDGLGFWTARLRGGTINGHRPWLCRREFFSCIASGWTLVTVKYAERCDRACRCG